MSNASASQTAGMVGKFGQSTFTSVSQLGRISSLSTRLTISYSSCSGSGQRNPRLPPKPSKFFKSRNKNDVSEAILEEEEENVQESLLEDSAVTSGFQTPSTSEGKSENITVGVRVRPGKETEENVLQVEASQLVVDNDEKKIFNFDTVFKSEESQERLYQDLVQSKVEKFLEGVSSTVFAYGQTGTGKTFSMGTTNTQEDISSESRGIILRSLDQIFSHKDVRRMKVWISFLEIHKEQVYDLLKDGKSSLSVREVQPGLFRVIDLNEIQVTSVSEALEILSRGSILRSTEATVLNFQSSRSHAVFTVRLESEVGDGISSRKLSLVDLAGSENNNKTKTTGNRFEEAKSINLGLTVLNRVMTGLVRRQKHIPHRDSMLTKVLKEGLQLSCHISMLACISPDQADMTETLNTLRFCNDAKHLRLRPLPARILETCRASAAKRRELGLGISATPLGRANNTIHGTPGTGTGTGPVKRQALNRTIGTPGKRAKTEEDFLSTSTMRSMVSSTVSKVSSLQSLSDLSSVSMIEPPLEATVSSAVSIQHDVTGLLSPLLRTVRETVQEEMMKIKSEMIHPQVSTRKARRPNKSRATSSPNKTNLLPFDMEEEEDIVKDNIEVTVAADEQEDIISGVGLSFPQLPRSVNPRHRAVMESASPSLPSSNPPLFQYDSPPSSSRQRSQSPTIEEMERNLGINPDSPSLMFNVTQQTGTVVKKSRKSSRRTTLVGTDLNETLKEIQNFTNSNRRRSVRTATKGIFYGSPSQRPERLDENGEQEETQEPRHPLLGLARKMDPARQLQHNQTILDFINIATVKHLGVS